MDRCPKEGSLKLCASHFEVQGPQLISMMPACHTSVRMASIWECMNSFVSMMFSEQSRKSSNFFIHFPITFVLSGALGAFFSQIVGKAVLQQLGITESTANADPLENDQATPESEFGGLGQAQ